MNFCAKFGWLVEDTKVIGRIKRKIKNMVITKEQKQSIAHYRRMGLEMDILNEETIKITQFRLINGNILNQKQLVERTKKVFPKMHIIPVVYSLDVEDISLEWIKSKMEEFGIKRKDLIKQLALDKPSLSLLFSGKQKIDINQKAAFFFYFLTYELNRDFREQGNEIVK